MSTIQAIPTKYKGITFRSRLEARWAMFFDLLGIKWAYEYEGFNLPSGWYVPDFWLPDVGKGVFLEIKPFVVNEVRLIELEAMTSKQTLMGIGNPERDALECFNSPSDQDHGDPTFRQSLMKCVFCGHTEFSLYPFGITCRDCWCARVKDRDFGVLEAMEAADKLVRQYREGHRPVINDDWIGVILKAVKHNREWRLVATRAAQKVASHRFH